MSLSQGVSKIMIAGVLIATLVFETACSQSEVLTTLNLIVTAATTAVDVLQSAGVLPPGTAALVLPYLNGVSAAVDYATTELGSTDSASVKAAKITQQFAMIVAPNLPPGTASAIVSAIEEVAGKVAAFLSTLQVGAGKLALEAPDSQVPVSKGDAKALGTIKARNAHLHARLNSLAR